MLADGSIVRTDAETRPELFWAVRGAGANLGIVTSFEFEADEVGQVGWAQLAFDASDAEEFLAGYGRLMEAAPRDLTMFLVMGAIRPGQPRIAQVYGVVDSADPDTIATRLQPFAELAPLVQQCVPLTAHAAVMANADPRPHHGSGEPHSRSGLVTHITPEFARDVVAMVDAGSAHFLQFRPVGGAVADVPAGETVYTNRSANFSVVALGPNIHRLDASWDAVRSHLAGMYLSFDTSLRTERLVDAFGAEALERLRAIKAEVDPDGVFADNFSVMLDVEADAA